MGDSGGWGWGTGHDQEATGGRSHDGMAGVRPWPCSQEEEEVEEKQEGKNEEKEDDEEEVQEGRGERGSELEERGERRGGRAVRQSASWNGSDGKDQTIVDGAAGRADG